MDNVLTATETHEAFEIYRGDEVCELPAWLIPAHLCRSEDNESTEPVYAIRGEDIHEIDEDCVVHVYYGAR